MTVISARRCTRFGFNICGLVIREGERLFLRDMPELSQDVPFPQLKDRALVAMRQGATGAANTLLLYVGERVGSTRPPTRSESGCGTAGDMTPVWQYSCCSGKAYWTARPALNPRPCSGIVRRIQGMAFVNEDVHGGWSRTLELRGGDGRARLGDHLARRNAVVDASGPDRAPRG